MDATIKVAGEVSRLVQDGGPIARGEVRGRLGRTTQTTCDAIRLLVDGGYVRVTRAARRKAVLHHVRPFGAGGEQR